MIYWNAQPLIESTVRDYIEAALPDAHDTDDLTYAVAPDGDKLRVEVDIPTSDMEAWLMLMVDVNGDEPAIASFSCLRSGLGNDAEDVYEWTQDKPEWTLKEIDD